jgi:hypothetical protein
MGNYIINEHGEKRELFIPKDELMAFLKLGGYYNKHEDKKR